ncbi:crotonyl-CoA carboxylase/reductase [Brenneria goodwinii]|uniref:crotonyl-CoA carboxylase/reductase n=1 Tax=Brenneria goodwinii TaxID=1109412 RepID=UPI000EF234BD|nr:crotonyl-CoA carboxylase/reductase [Brenneria goodwinii]MCG8157180.1 crotonyl-CoA carboxylase/reductase [Brenneria goodwinii]MCG8160080.1 crotonyl-CoA carboxylase/reductase [Brenneria goodwinii]MCG8164603.1 crotonyl-CoA carboxylase/reductase [Brenneria goodwinii]MCG8170691.1 crotonyl-CoA carboxylase/reductase [Brenneria goodwinii]MCG8174219.1 crotonyl-CoA carboxylase/reductase [Brenneria goodwinii]
MNNSCNNLHSSNKLENNTLPEIMLAQTIRQSRFGEPISAFKFETVPIPKIDPNECLIKVMAAGINHNGIWAAAGFPVDVIKLHKSLGELDDFHIAGSDASGIVVSVGSNVKKVKVGDEVVLHCGWWSSQADEDEIMDNSAKIWGYEINYGAFAEYTRVKEQEVLPKPKQLSWEESASYMLCGSTAYRMLYGFAPNQVRRDDVVLIWGGSGGLGSMAIQLANAAGAIPIVVVSSEEKARYCLKIGAKGVINRLDYKHWGALYNLNDTSYTEWLRESKRFQREIWKLVGEKKNPSIIIEHPGEDTFPTSSFVCAPGGMVVICAGTSGFKGTFDIRYHWMRQKRFQGSHFANQKQCIALNKLVCNGIITPCLTRAFDFRELPEAHQIMFENRDLLGNYVVRIGCRDM